VIEGGPDHTSYAKLFFFFSPPAQPAKVPTVRLTSPSYFSILRSKTEHDLEKGPPFPVAHRLPPILQFPFARQTIPLFHTLLTSLLLLKLTTTVNVLIGKRPFFFSLSFLRLPCFSILSVIDYSRKPQKSRLFFPSCFPFAPPLVSCPAANVFSRSRINFYSISPRSI